MPVSSADQEARMQLPVREGPTPVLLSSQNQIGVGHGPPSAPRPAEAQWVSLAHRTQQKGWRTAKDVQF
jgi:hypothetical protein